MGGPDRGNKKRYPDPANEPVADAEEQQHIQHVQQDIDDVVADGAILITENRVVDEIRESRQWTVQIAVGIGPPVRPLEDRVDIRGRGGAQPRILEDENLAVADKGGAEGVRIDEKGQ